MNTTLFHEQIGIQMVRFTVPAVPVAQPRQRHRVVRTHGGKVFAHNYTPTQDPVNAFKAAVQVAASKAYAGAPLQGPLSLSLLLLLPRPKSLCWKTRPMPRQYHQGRPDADNFAKSVKDALNQILWRDDGQISHLDVLKFIAAGDESPHAEIIVSKLTD